MRSSRLLIALLAVATIVVDAALLAVGDRFEVLWLWPAVGTSLAAALSLSQPSLVAIWVAIGSGLCGAAPHRWQRRARAIAVPPA
jgi:hypothetical protein